jgi:hypothetical protein
MRLLLSVAMSVSIAVFSQTELAIAGLFGSSWEDDRDKASSCFDSVYYAPEFREISDKLPIANPTLQQLSDESVPTESEAQKIRDRVDRARRCRELMMSAIREHHPYLLSAIELRYFQADIVYVQLLQRRITFGNANRLLQESWLQLREREDRYDQARSEEQRRALAESMRDLSRQAQSSPPPAGTGRMTCRWIGPTLYCDSY